MASKRTMMSPAEARVMHAKVVATKAANQNERYHASCHRLTDPLERAKTYLRAQRFHVFAQSVLGREFWNSKLIVVGKTAMEPDEVIAKAERMRARAE